MFSMRCASLGAAVGAPDFAVVRGDSATVNNVVVAVPGLPDILHNILGGASGSDFDVYGQVARDIIGAWTTVTVSAANYAGAGEARVDTRGWTWTQ